MQKVADIILEQATAYRGSETTKNMVATEIEKRWGKKELANYNPKFSARTYKSWKELGFKVRRGEKAIRSITYVDEKDATGNIIHRYRRPVFVFFYLQVEKIK